MKYEIHSRKIEINTTIREYIENKLGKLDKYFEDDTIISHVLLKARPNTKVIEVTIPIKKLILRAEVEHKDLYAAIDKVVDKLDGQIRKNKTRLKKRNKEIAMFNLDFEIDKEEEEKGKIVKKKVVEALVMSDEEAILQLNLLDHNFLMYKNEEQQLLVVYKRNDNDYGIIEIE